MTATGCACGAVVFEIDGPPIVTARCYCSSCRRAGGILGALPGATPILDDDGATPLVLVRVDRVRCVRGAEHLAEHRLSPKSPTRRIVATCCNTPIFLDFTKGYWLSWFWRPMQATGIPHPVTELNRKGGIPPGFLIKVLLAWAGKGFRVPKVDYVNRVLTVPIAENSQ